MGSRGERVPYTRLAEQRAKALLPHDIAEVVGARWIIAMVPRDGVRSRVQDIREDAHKGCDITWVIEGTR